HPFAAYAELAFRVPVFESGDVKARTLARVEEAREAVGLIRQALERMPGGPLAVALRPLPAFEPAFSLVEGWRGTIILDHDGRCGAARAGQGARPVVPELASAVIRSAQEHRSRLPALQQVVQSVLLGERPLAGIIHDRRTLCREALRPRQASHAGRRSGRAPPSGPRPLEYPRGRR